MERTIRKKMKIIIELFSELDFFSTFVPKHLTTMKKIIILAVMALVAFQATAQLTLTPRVGLNLANVSVSGDGSEAFGDTKMRTGFLVGANLDYSLNEMWSVGLGLAYSQKGFKQETTIPLIGSFKTDFSSNYLEIPIMANAHFGNQDGVMFNIGAGPYIGLALGGNTKVEALGQSDSEAIKVGNGEDDDLAPMDFGLNIGAGVTYKKINLGVQYGLGLSNIIPSASGDNLTGKNGVIGISVGYRIPFGGK
jgi:hypothetical protein